MSELRELLHAARSTHRTARFAGDLGELVNGARRQPGREAARGGFVRKLGLGLAAAVLLLVCGLALQMSGRRMDAAPVSLVLPSLGDMHLAPRAGVMKEAVKTLTPPEVPDLLMQVKQPLVSSGEFIVNIGKDVAHHADALFHMG